MIKFKTVTILMVLSAAILLLGCNKKQPEVTTNENIETTKLSEILTKTDNFADKIVTVNGNFFASCSDSCCDNEFILKDGINQIKVFKSKELELPKMKPSQPIRISGILKATAENPVIMASSVEIIK
jgi:uncharacterized protein YdeI (BOF family)